MSKEISVIGQRPETRLVFDRLRTEQGVNATELLPDQLERLKSLDSTTTHLLVLCGPEVTADHIAHLRLDNPEIKVLDVSTATPPQRVRQLFEHLDQYS